MRFSIPKQFIVPSVVQESECLMQECHQAQILPLQWRLDTTGHCQWMAEVTISWELPHLTEGTWSPFKRGLDEKLMKQVLNHLSSALCIINWYEFHLLLCKPAWTLELFHSLSPEWWWLLPPKLIFMLSWVNIVLSYADLASFNGSTDHAVAFWFYFWQCTFTDLKVLLI